MFMYQQSSGAMTKTFSLGYSGAGEGKNNPAFENHPDLGPLPKGDYLMEVIKDSNGVWIDYEGKKAPVIRLFSSPENVMFGRSGFLIHGDSISNPGTASKGCVIENHADRVAIAHAVEAGDNRLRVF